MIEAARFFDGQSATPQPVTVQVQNNLLMITGADGILLAAWAPADVELAGSATAASGSVLRYAGHPQRLVLNSPTLIAALRGAGGILPEEAPWDTGRWAALAGAMVAALVVAWVLIDRLPGMAAPFVPQRLERSWSNQAQAILGAVGPVCTAPAGNQALQHLMARLAAGAGLAAPPEIDVLDTRVVNAFTLPDGHILLMRGLIDEADDQDEVAGVLAHELGHVKHHDPTREMLRRLALNMVARSVGWGGGVVTSLTALSYGRQAEARADASAVETLKTEGMRADGLSRFFVRLRARAGTGGVPAFLSDHPATEDREARLRQPATGAHAMEDADWQALRDVCGPS